MTSGTRYRFSAFSSSPHGGNPAGVWFGDTLPEPGEMQRIAAEVGYSETAFVTPHSGVQRTVRYYSPGRRFRSVVMPRSLPGLFWAQPTGMAPIA